MSLGHLMAVGKKRRRWGYIVLECVNISLCERRASVDVGKSGLWGQGLSDREGRPYVQSEGSLEELGEGGRATHTDVKKTDPGSRDCQDEATRATRATGSWKRHGTDFSEAWGGSVTPKHLHSNLVRLTLDFWS